MAWVRGALEPCYAHGMAGRKKAQEDLSGLYLACFELDQPPDEGGSFQVVVQASSPEDAERRIKERLRVLRTKSSLFDKPCSIFLNGLIRLAGPLDEGLVVNLECGTAEIGEYHLLPEQPDQAAEAYEPPLEDGGIQGPFLDFGGAAFYKALASAKRSSASPVQTHRPVPQQAPREEIKIVQPRTKPKSESGNKGPPARKPARVRETRQERKEAIGRTLAEIGVVTKRRRSRG